MVCVVEIERQILARAYFRFTSHRRTTGLVLILDALDNPTRLNDPRDERADR